MKRVYEFIQEELNKYDYFDLVQDEVDKNIIYLVWKDTEDKFAEVYISEVVKAINNLNNEGVEENE